eukprot:scaffold78791_cov24-Attheya_sp.AAC.1
MNHYRDAEDVSAKEHPLPAPIPHHMDPNSCGDLGPSLKVSPEPLLCETRIVPARQRFHPRWQSLARWISHLELPCPLG